jgi:hypothetical protein
MAEDKLGRHGVADDSRSSATPNASFKADILLDDSVPT